MSIPVVHGRIPQWAFHAPIPALRERPAPRRSEVRWYPIHVYQHDPPSQSAAGCPEPMCLYRRRRRPVDMWTSPHPCGPARAEPCGQPMDRAEVSVQNASTAQARPTGCPHSRASRPHSHRPYNKLLLKKREEVERRHPVPIVDRSKHISPNYS